MATGGSVNHLPRMAPCEGQQVRSGTAWVVAGPGAFSTNRVPDRCAESPSKNAPARTFAHAPTSGIAGACGQEGGPPIIQSAARLHHALFERRESRIPEPMAGVGQSSICRHGSTESPVSCSPVFCFSVSREGRPPTIRAGGPPPRCLPHSATRSRCPRPPWSVRLLR